LRFLSGVGRPSLRGFGVIGEDTMVEEPIRIGIPMPSVEEQKAVIDAHALAVGRVTQSWNLLQDTLASIFVQVLGGDGVRQLAFAIWFSSDSDRVQNRMLKDAVSIELPRWPERTKAKDDILWLISEATSLADHRNNAVHAPIAIFIGREPGTTFVGPSIYPRHPRAMRLLNKGDLVEEFQWVERWSDVLISFGRQIESGLNAGNNPWPDRPKRPDRGQRTFPPGPPLQPFPE
jgi:hypothetical protein